MSVRRLFPPLAPRPVNYACVDLTPFVLRLHADAYWEHVGLRPKLFQYYSFLNATLPGFLTYLETSFRRNPEWILFAIIGRRSQDTTQPELDGRLAGVIGAWNASAKDLSAEIAHIVVFPKWQGTGVGARAAVLLTRFCLQLPDATPLGLGMRRVQWVVHPDNRASIGLVKKLGMKQEGFFRWCRVLPDGWAGNKPRQGDPLEYRDGRNTVYLAICWDDWEQGGRESAQALIEKPLAVVV
ncbi:acyl-CoA N-acyltransferase [Obba rivulosa]|uniref:Acyl-CoA N-acyltransferase n=1 Tax=Obba rivulosa TaxID=1052685 RepID=A0A8E2AWZ0_9APHY|nr:acyl-CoA N-acyltransferase [Obba rivulosa]